MFQFNRTKVTSTEVLTAINEAVIKNVAKCTGGSDTVQNVNLIATDHSAITNVLVSQNITQHMTCISELTNQIKLENDITSKLQAVANSKSGFVLGIAVNKASTSTTVIRSIINKHMIDNIQSCESKNNWTQTVNAVASDFSTISNATLKQNGSAAMACMFGAENMINVTNKIATDINSAANSGGNALGKVLMVVLIVAIVIAGLVGIGAAVYYIRRRQVQRGTYQAPPPL